MKIEDTILNIIAEYRELPPDYVDIVHIMDIRKKLATYGTNLGVEVSNARKVWKRAVFKYEVERNQKEIIFYKQQKNLGKAEKYAKANTVEFQGKSIEAENRFYELDYILKSLKEVLGELNQRVAHLREELKQEKFFNTDN